MGEHAESHTGADNGDTRRPEAEVGVTKEEAGDKYDLGAEVVRVLQVLPSHLH